MQQAALGSTGIVVSRLGLGTAKLGRDQAVKHPTPFTIPDDDQARALLDRARDLGINLLDTAPAYGASEERLGRLLRGEADRWVISTKVGEQFENGTSTFDFTTAAVRASVERSLKRLGREALDIVLIHSGGRDDEAIRATGALLELRELQRQGKVRAVGASTKTLAGAFLAVDLCDVVMLTLNPASTTDLPALRLAGERSVGVLVKKPLDSGHAALGADNRVEDAFRFIFAEPAATAAVVGTINPDHLAANVAAVEAALAAGEPASPTSANRR